MHVTNVHLGTFMPGEGSASTFWDNDPWHYFPANRQHNGTSLPTEPRVTTANLIHDILPDARFIVILRDPTERYIYITWFLF